jgi:hypothetical protein
VLARRLLANSGGAGGFPGWTRGTLTAGGSPATVLADGSFNSQAGIAWLDATRVLVVFSDSSSNMRGIIGTLSGTWTFTWGSAFTILASPTNCYDAVSVVDGKLVVAGNVFSGGTTHSPFLLICDSSPAAMTSSSTWGAAINLPTDGADAYIQNGPVQKLINGHYLVAAQMAGNAHGGNGVILSTSLTDWSAATFVQIGAPAGSGVDYTEIVVDEMPSGTVIAHLRHESPKEQYIATSTDHGATWTSPASAFSGYGFPMFKILTTGLQLAVYRQATGGGLGATYWRQSADDGATWSGETLLDGTLIGGQPSYSAYATILQLDALHALCVYSIGDQRGGAFPANLYSQVFTDSSTRP